ncbi:TIR domain-containing protein [Bradyrhizobium guangzhouense]|uniref:TIR-like domain-containing protein n=1 Tax=Bradyrhizobium guangzhouense TaxID=1325095 RepID=A0AAE6CBC4_9BRAD|nr:TIR domain-containing protein [Bradyrhizobium guangzhouense]QAU49673.1 TIR-like domain-containing protein [Bradyrhizobium guangzhouense]
MAKKVIFISFDYDNDAHYKNLLLAWDKNKEFDFELYNGSLKDAINSTNATYIKSKIKPLIAKASHLLCIVGKQSASSDWITWEIQTAVDAKKKLIGVKVEKAYDSPKPLINNGATWALSFNFDAIKKAVESA